MSNNSGRRSFMNTFPLIFEFALIVENLVTFKLLPLTFMFPTGRIYLCLS